MSVSLLGAAAHGFDVRAVGELSEDAPQSLELAREVLDAFAQSLVVRCELDDFLLRLGVAHLGLVAALAHGHVVTLAPQPVLGAVLVDVLLRFGPVACAHHFGREAALLLVMVLVLVVRAGHRGGRRRRVTRLQVHGGLRAVRDLVLQVRQVWVVLVVRVVVVGAGLRRVPELSEVAVLARLLLDRNGSHARLVHGLEFGRVAVVRHRAAIRVLRPGRAESQTVAVLVVTAVRQLELLETRAAAAVEQVSQELVVKRARVDVRADIDGALVLADRGQVVLVAVAVLHALGEVRHQGPRGCLVQVCLLHGVPIARLTW